MYTTDQIAGVWDCLHQYYAPGIDDAKRRLQAQVCGNLTPADAALLVTASNQVISASGGPGNVSRELWSQYVTAYVNNTLGSGPQVPLPVLPGPPAGGLPTFLSGTDPLGLGVPAVAFYGGVAVAAWLLVGRGRRRR